MGTPDPAAHEPATDANYRGGDGSVAREPAEMAMLMKQTAAKWAPAADVATS